jgi:hypothetical protein
MILLFSIAIGLIAVRGMSSHPDINEDYAVLMLLVAPLFWAWFRWVRPHLAPRMGWKAIPIGRQSTRYAAVLVALLAATMVWTSLTRWGGECPHARYYAVGPFCMAWSNHGGPCGNWAEGGSTHLFGNWYFFSTWFEGLHEVF